MLKSAIKRILILLTVGLIVFIGVQYGFTLLRPRRTKQTGSVSSGPPTEAVTVKDVLEADLPMPTLSRVSFPSFPYRKAFPEATDEAEVVIDSFDEAPWLKNRAQMPEDLRRHFPADLPPVEERLPLNPAVVRGPDSPGRYGGTWRRATPTISDLSRKIGYESFVRFDPAGRLQPGVAYRWTVENSNRVYTFYLRPGHRWSSGEPFTSHDITWVCNTLIGSAHWPSPPNWMQPRDGTMNLYPHDIGDWQKLAAAILEQGRAEGATPGKAVLAAGGEDLKRLLQSVAKNGPPGDEKTRTKLVTMFNAAFRKPACFVAEAWDELDLTAELDAFREKGYSRLSDKELDRVNLLFERNDLFEHAKGDVAALKDRELSRLNLLLFRKAFRDLVRKGTLRRVKVEAVPDASGDDSHIVRFTFPEPNSIFLEKTGTFMFYRGLFGLPRSHTAQYHPEGSDVLNVIDVVDWEIFRASLQGTPFADAATLDDRQSVIDAVNRRLRDPDCFSPDDWENLDLRGEYRELTRDGFSQVSRDTAALNRVSQLLVRRDLLRRVEENGIDSLSDEETFQFNLVLFRAQFDDVTGNGCVARNREAALNRQAQNHPRKYSSWPSLLRASSKYHPELNPHPPTIRAWRLVTESEAKEQVAIRNPYYYRVDEEGNQLPYINTVKTTMETEKPNILLKMAAGAVDFQVREITFENFTFLKEHEEQGDYEILLWANDYVGEVTFLPLQAHRDPQWVDLQNDPRFRHALSYAINRQEIIDVVYSGFGEPAQFSVPQGSPYYNALQANMAVEYNPKRANELLDDIGLAKRAADGTRLLPNGKPLIINVDTTSERPLEVVQMVCTYWQKVGVNARMKVRSPGLMSRMRQMGIADIMVHKEGGNFFGPLAAGGYAPTHPAEAVQWAQWASYVTSGGRRGWEAPERLLETNRLWEDVLTAPNEREKLAAWQRLATHTAKRLPIIGLMTSPGKVVYVSRRMRNVPKLSLAGWIAHEPGNCCPESFYYAEPRED